MILPSLRLTPQAGPATWQGTALTPADWMLPVGAEEAADLESAIAAPGAAPSGRLGALLGQVSDRLENGRGFVLLRGLPLGRFDAPGGAEALLRTLGAWLGTALPQDAAGTLVSAQDGERVFPLGAAMRFHADPADAVVLFCLRQVTEGGSVTLLSAPALHNVLLKANREALAVLHQGLPQHGPEGGQPALVPVFARAEGAFVGRCDHAAIAESALTGEHRAALTALENAATTQGLALTIPLHPGDLLFRNPMLVWKRAGAPVAVDGQRALLRLWLATPGARALPEGFRAALAAHRPAAAMVGG
jgi:hypothetical protein